VIKRSLNILRYWLPVVLWMAVISYISSVPGSEFPDLGIVFADKIFHFTEYFILGVLLAKAISATSAGFKTLTRDKVFHIILISVIISLLYGMLDEFHQLFVAERGMDLLDLLSDVSGASIGAALFLYRERKDGGNKGL